MMRGVDYRAESDLGIALLVAQNLGSMRDYIQALGRVGRSAQPCLRFRTVAGVDEEKEDALVTDLIAKIGNA